MIFPQKKWKKKKSTETAGFVASERADPAILQMAAGFVAPAGRHILRRGHGKVWGENARAPKAPYAFLYIGLLESELSDRPIYRNAQHCVLGVFWSFALVTPTGFKPVTF